jgi:hypothetical protein
MAFLVTVAVVVARAGVALAQAAVREHHENSNTLVVGGWRSEPRSVVCTS